MKGFSQVKWACLAVVSVSCLATATATAIEATPVAPTTTTATDFDVVYQGAYRERFASISATDDTHAWVVGTSQEPERDANMLVADWDGTSWQSSTSEINQLGNLYGVSAINATEAWAVGASGYSGYYHPFISHHTASGWVTTPPPDATRGGSLKGVTAIDGDNAWAVGEVYGPSIGDTTPLVERWDGQAWSSIAVPLPPGTQSAWLSAVDAAGPNNVWASGIATVNNSGTVERRILLEHWDGVAMSYTLGATLAGSAEQQSSVVSVGSATSAWLAYNDGYPQPKPSVNRWDGAQWSPGPDTPPDASPLHIDDLASDSAGHVWSSGKRLDPSVYSRMEISYWHGTQWQVKSLPPLTVFNFHRTGITMTPGQTSVWAFVNGTILRKTSAK